MAGVTVHVIGLGYVLLVVDTVEVVDHVRASIVCAVSVRSIRTVRVVGAVGLGMLWRSGLVVCGECWHVIGSGGYVLVGVFVVLWVVLCMVGLLCLVSYCPADGVVGIGTAGIVLVCLVMLSAVVLVIVL